MGDTTVVLDSATNSIKTSSHSLENASYSVSDIFLDYPGDLHLKAGSAAIDSANAALLTALSDIFAQSGFIADLDGKAMPQSDLDFGAYQFSSP